MRIASSALLFLAFAGTARADIVPPDSKAIRHRVRFENLEDHPGFVFYVYPRDLPRDRAGNSSVRVGKRGEAELSALNPLAVGMAGGAFLYAVPATLHAGRDLPDEAWFQPGKPAGVRSARLVAPRKHAMKSDPYDTIETRYRVQGLPGSLDLALVREETLAGGVPVRAGSVRWFLLGVPVLAAAWIAFRVAVRKRRPAA